MPCFSAYTEVEVDIPEETVRQWAAELNNDRSLSKAEAKNDLENIHLFLRQQNKLAMVGRLNDIIKEYF